MALNKLHVKDKFPIPIVKELVGATIFSKVDLRVGYHQIRMAPDDVYKTTSRTHKRHNELIMMPFNLTNAITTFQSLINDIFRNYLRKFILMFLDDILIYNKSREDHLEHMKIVFEILMGHSLFFKRSICVFRSTQIEYSGHIISRNEVAIDPQKIQAVLDGQHLKPSSS
jgi:hypothetical protein